MKYLLPFFLFFSVSLSAQPLVTNQMPIAGKGNTYALIIGVANYLDPDIPQLQFSNRDAQIFADFLQSKGGGAVPKENIRLLVDSAATTGAVYDAVYLLKNVCTKDNNDIAYIYFSGHGDLENITMYNNGFLICYDSPPINYVKLALSIDYLNDIANTLSIEKQAHVILITDACHSGKLTEKKFKGNFLAGNQLRKFQGKEIRITSSSADQLSNEKEDWGGGRGVFSYYLVRGLKGLADKNKKGVVTVADIKNYLDSSLANDKVLKMDNIKQTPVVNGNDSYILTTVNAEEMQFANQMVTEDNIRVKALNADENNIPELADEYFFSLLKKKSLEALTDTLKLDEIEKEKITFTLIEFFKNDLMDTAGEKKLEDLHHTLQTDKEALNQFNSRLAVLFDAAGQHVITQYLKGDAAELEKRRYYNASYKNYDIYPRMYKVALKLIPADNEYYYNMIRFKLHYFTGVAARLKIPLTKDHKPLIEKALAEQKKALALEEYAAYIYNELGILYSYKKNEAEAEKYFKIAALRASDWAIPRSNLADLYTAKGQLAKALVYADSAKNLQPDFQDIYMSYGLIYEKKANLLQAEEAFQKSIKLNSRHFLPFESLGSIYMNTLQFAEADSMFFEAAERKRGFFFDEGYNTRQMKLPKMDLIPGIVCNIDSSYTGSKDIMGQFALGYTAYRDYDLAKAERAFKRVIALDVKNPLAYHYLGRTLADQHRWQEAELIFKKAIDNYLPDSLWTKYYDSLLDKSSLSTDFIIDPCSDSCFRFGYYDKAEDYLLMAELYENWNHYSESELYYRKLISADPNKPGGYLSLINLFEKTGRFNDAENYLLEYNIRSNYSIDKSLETFYRRVTEKFSENADWYLKAGNFQYTIARSAPQGFTEDMKWIDPITHETVYQFPQKKEVKLPPPHVYRLLPYGTVIPNNRLIKPKFKPFTNGIYYLRKAAELVQFDETLLAGINTKLGDLYNWQGLPDSAIYFYETAIELNPADAGIRNKLVEAYTNSYRFAEATAQLDSLLQKHEINMDKQLLLAKFNMHDGRFNDAEKLLKDAENIDPVFNVELTALKAKLAVTTKNTKLALEICNLLFMHNKDDSMNLYTIARIHALAGNKAQAWKWLKLAMQAGFNYHYVFNYDPAMKSLRNDVQWKKIIPGITGDEYGKSFLQTH